MALMLSACATPNINSLDPNSGPERSLVEIDGDNLFSTAYWDAGTASEQSLQGGFFGSYIFTVPQAASLGAHQVQLKRSGKEGNKVPFTVTATVPFGSPRLDRVSLVYADFQPANQVNTWVYVQGANVDVSAEVLINGTVVPTVAHKGIVNDLLGVNPQDLNFPIYHHLALLAAPGSVATGSNLNVQIRNADGLLSNIIVYRMPNDAATMDSDGDDIPDTWEINGYDADGDGTIDIDLKALGADPHRPDIFVEVDVMNSLTNSPGAAVWTAVRTAFANAPVINPGSDNGINVSIDTSGSVPFWQTINLTGTASTTFENFYTLKTANFDNDVRGRIYHYCIWANAHPSGWSGISDVDWVNGGDDCIVSFDDFPASYQSVRSMAATFMHEFGHNLNQKHGGVDHYNKNPVYSSVMSYSWQLRTGLNNASRRSRPIYSPFYYQLNGAVETNGAIPAGVTNNLPDYSQGMGRNLLENNLNEPAGLYNGNAVDWNQDGDSTDTGVTRDLNSNGSTTDTITDFSNWSNLNFSGPRNNGTYSN
ncbi:MAG: hypothetical protein IMF15_09615 [Proteobacteria bacterium]|nr:hypothetical protein [Pseudomonadota bacterium]